MASAVYIKGMRELSAAFARAGKEAQKELRDELAKVAEPIRRDAEQNARAEIARIGPKWSAMRVGVTRRVVYVAPKARGVGRGVGGRRRPNLAPLLMERAMRPALERNRFEVAEAADRALGRVGKDWARGG